jgi:hypothetical protein
MTKRSKIAFAAVAVVALATAGSQAAFAGGRVGGGQGRNVDGGVCQSGKHVKDTKTCKENGGKN